MIIPAYNEAGIIGGSLNETIRVFNNFGCKYEIVVVDDGSSDNTFQNILKVSSRHTNIIVKQLKHNRGKGRALKVGFRQCAGEYVVFLDADMELHPAQLQTFLTLCA